MSLRPVSLEVEGFLSFRSKGVIDFRHADVYAITGKNGAGKSSLLNGITFALFGMVYGKKKGLDEIIHDRADQARVAFTFLLDDRLFRVTRIAMRRKTNIASEGLIEFYDGTKWHPVPHTSKIGEMESWITRRLRIRAESFTASAALMQNDQMKLFEGTPAEMGKTLTDIVGLDYWAALERHIRDMANQASGRSKELTKVLEGIPIVTEDELAKALAAVEAATQEAEDANTARDEAVVNLERAEKRHTLTREQKCLKSDETEATEFAARLQELREATQVAQSARDQMHMVAAVVRGRASLASTIAQIEETERQRSELEQRFAVLKSEVEDLAKDEEEASARYRISLRQAEDLEGSTRKTEERLRHAQDRATVSAEIARLEEEIAQINDELKDLPQLEAIVRHRDKITRMSSEMAALERALDEREVARVDVGSQEGEIEALRAKLTSETTRAETMAGEIAKARVREKDIEKALESARATYQREKAVLDARLSAANSDACYVCGEPIREHKAETLAQEIADLQASLGRVQKQGIELNTNYSGVRSAREGLERDHAALLAANAGLEREITKGAQRLKALTEKRDARHKTARDLWHAMLTVAAEVGIDIGNPSDPGARDRLKERLAEREQTLVAVLPRHQQLEARRTVRTRLEQDTERARKRLTSLPDPGLPVETLQAEAESARKALAEARKTRDEYAEAAAELRRTLEEKKAAANEVYSNARAAKVQLDGLLSRRQEIEDGIKTAWEETLQAGWPEGEDPTQDDVDRLKEAAGLLLQLKRNLEKAEEADKKLTSLRERLTLIATELEQLADAPDLESAKVALARARERVDKAQKALRDASSTHERLDNDAKRRKEIEDQLDAVDSDGSRVRALVAPLGKKGLQARLMHRALVGIIQAANDVLSRISDSKLSLELHIGEEDDDFQIKVRDALAPDRPRSFTFISGGMKFRVAVAMAIGIGQYLSAQSNTHRVEMLIIDEGFGALDEDAFDVMLEELDRIAADVGTVVIVTHNPKVRQAISDRYHVTRDEDTARVERQVGFDGLYGEDESEELDDAVLEAELL